MIDRTIAPEYSLPSTIELVKAEKYLLQNGLPVHIINAGEQNVLRIEFIFTTGSKHDSKTGISYFAGKMLTGGTNKHNASEIFQYIDQFGAFYELNHGVELINLTVFTLTKYLDQIVSLVKELILESEFPEDELNNIKNITSQNLKVNLNKTSYIASNKFRENLFGKESPFGKNLYEEDIQKINRADVKNFYNNHLLKTKLEIVISGKVEDKSLHVLDKYLGDIPRTKITESELYSIPHLPDEKLLLIEKPESVQSSIRMGKPIFSKNHPDYFNFSIFNEIFGGYFGSRLMKNIREEKGYTYGIHSHLVSYQQFGYFVIGTDVKREYTRDTISEIKKEISILKEKPISADELHTVKNYMKGSFLNDLNSPFAHADKFKSTYFYNLDYSFYERFLNAIDKVTPKTIRDTANKYFQDDDLLTVVVGGY